MHLSLHHVIIGLTHALDLVGVDEVRHGKRVAAMAEAVARELGWSKADRDFILHAGMLHDCGVSRTLEHQDLAEEFEWKGVNAHCHRGEHYLLECPPLADFAPVIRWHHTHWENLPASLPEKIRLSANLIFLVDRVDVLQIPYIIPGAGLKNSILWEYPAIIEQVREFSGSCFAPVLVEAFVSASMNEAFWLAMEADYLDEDIKDFTTASDQQLSMPDMLNIANLFARIVDAKSAYTHDHSQRVGKISRYLAEQEGLTGNVLDLIEAAGLLHDLGKLRVPDYIIDKPAPLNLEERASITRHAYDSFRILKNVFGNSRIAHWAGAHHENLLGTGYPFRQAGVDMDLESRIISVADIFQALAQDRPYRDPQTRDEVFAQLTQLAQAGCVDSDVVSLLGRKLDVCYALATEG
ncbi:MAG: HD domain-containing protein [Gallionella sp.]|nr:HD domain-containing protein [Gallionella sp.]